MEDDEAFPSFGLIRFIISDNPYSNQDILNKKPNILKNTYIIVRIREVRYFHFPVTAKKRTRKFESSYVHSMKIKRELAYLMLIQQHP